MNKKSNRQLILCVAASYLIAAAAYSYSQQWSVDVLPSTAFEGTITLNDGSGSNAFTRPDGSALNSNVPFQTSSPSAIVLDVASVDIEFQIVSAGSAVTKKSCSVGKTWDVYASVVTMCDQGQANPIAGQHIDAVDGGGTFTPRLWLFTNRGSGGAWRQITGSCAQLEVRQLCK